MRETHKGKARAPNKKRTEILTLMSKYSDWRQQEDFNEGAINTGRNETILLYLMH
jgi:hypothetical protein